MAYSYSVTDLLNSLNELGFFSYVLPFLIVFAIVFGILEKTKIFGNEAKGVNTVLALGIAGMSLLFDQVSTFYAIIFPNFGVGLAVFLVLVIALGFFYADDEGAMKSMSWIGWVIGIGVVLWTFNQWTWYGGGWGFGMLLQQYLPIIIILALIGGGIALVMGGGKNNKRKGK